MLAISVIAFIIIVVADYFRPIPPEVRMQALRHQVSELRAAADSCRSALEDEEARLRDSDARFDSLKSQIEYYEGLVPRGVPADSYDVYIEIFNDYNEGIPEREAAGERLEVNWEACRAITERHNQIADSAHALATELGLMRDSVLREPVAPESPDSAHSANEGSIPQP